MPVVKRFDFCELEIRDDSAADGMVRAGATLTRAGVFEYRRADGSAVRELRHPDDVGAATHLATIKLLPVTLDHPAGEMVDAGNFKRLAVGATGDTVKFDGDRIRADVLIGDAAAISKAKTSHKELSLGYTVEIVPESGEYKGERYDQRQTNLRANHLALVRRGRAGVARLDGDDQVLDTSPDAQPAQTGATDPEVKPMAAKIRIDGVEHEIADATLAATLQGKLDALATATARADALGAKAESDKAEHAKAVEQARKDGEQIGRKSAALRAAAAAAGVEIKADADDCAVKVAMLKKLGGAAIEPKLANRSDAELDAMLDALSVAPRDKTGEQRAALGGAAPRKDDAGDLGDADAKALIEAHKAAGERWRGKPAAA